MQAQSPNNSFSARARIFIFHRSIYSSRNQRHENEFIKCIHLSCWLVSCGLTFGNEREAYFDIYAKGYMKGWWVEIEKGINCENALPQCFLSEYEILDSFTTLFRLRMDSFDWLVEFLSQNMRGNWNNMIPDIWTSYNESVCNFDAIIFAERDTSI